MTKSKFSITKEEVLKSLNNYYFYNSLLGNAFLDDFSDETKDSFEKILRYNKANRYKGIKSIIDFGCGKAPLTPLIPKGVSYLGLDNSAMFIKHNKKENTKKNISFKKQDISNLKKIKSSSFDLGYISCSTLSYLSFEQRLKHFQEAYRVLKNGGRYFVSLGDYLYPYLEEEDLEMELYPDDYNLDLGKGIKPYIYGEFWYNYDQATGVKDIVHFMASKDKKHIVASSLKVYPLCLYYGIESYFYNMGYKKVKFLSENSEKLAINKKELNFNNVGSILLIK